jgi:hypothetical protein
MASDAAFTAAFSVATEQAAKLALGNNQTITGVYSNMTVVHVNHLPIVISLIGSDRVNVGTLLACVPKLKSSLESTRARLVGDD